MPCANADGEKNLGKDDEELVHSISHRTRMKRNLAMMSIRLFLSSLLLSSVMLLAPNQSPPILPAVTAATPRATTFTNPGHRRCIGQFLTSYATQSDTNNDESRNEKNRNGSVLHWLNENTSCDLPSDPSVPSWKRKKKDPSKTEGIETPAFDEDDEKDRPFHVVMLLMDNQHIHQEVVTLSSGFLAAGLKVTVLYIFQDDGTWETNERKPRIPDLIQSEIFQRMPPNDTIIERAQDSFRFVQLNLNDYTSDPNELGDCMYEIAASHPLDKCSIDMAPAVMKLLLDETRIHASPTENTDNDSRNGRSQRFDFVLMMDASFLGGLLFSEIKMIPSIVIGSHHTLMFAIEQEPTWNPSPNRKTLDRMDRIFLQRLYSLGLTGIFRKANKMRHSLGLNRLKLPLDHFLPVVAVLVDLIPSDIALPLSSSLSLADDTALNAQSDGGSKEVHDDDGLRSDEPGYGYRVHNMQPLISPCTLCLDEGTSRNVENNSSIIMVAPPAGVSAKWTRALIRALSLTKQSLEGYDDCLFDRATCRNGVVGFEVVWLAMDKEEDDRFPPVVPSFIHREVSESRLDSAIRNPNTIIALIHCDFESSILATFGVEIFCFSQSNRIPTIDSVGDLLHEKGFEEAANDMDSSSKLLRESLKHDNINPEEVATKLLNVLRRKSINSEMSFAAEEIDSAQKRNKEVANWVTSGLQRAVTIVQTSARLHRDNSWRNPRQMQRVISSAITQALHSIDPISQDENVQQVNSNRQDFGAKQNLYEFFSVFVAWLVFLSAAIFIILKDSVAMKRWRQHRHHQYYRSGGSIIDSCLSRLDDLEKAWDMLLSWSSELTAPKPDVDAHDRIGRSRSNENPVSNAKNEHQLPNNNNNNHHHGQMRRRRKMKATR